MHEALAVFCTVVIVAVVATFGASVLSIRLNLKYGTTFSYDLCPHHSLIYYLLGAFEHSSAHELQHDFLTSSPCTQDAIWQDACSNYELRKPHVGLKTYSKIGPNSCLNNMRLGRTFSLWIPFGLQRICSVAISFYARIRARKHKREPSYTELSHKTICAKLLGCTVVGPCDIACTSVNV